MSKETAYEALIDSLEQRRQPLSPEDSMAEAGRKILLDQFIEMLSHEDGSRVGEDPEFVHDMRVATRRMRSTLRLLEVYYKPKAIRGYMRQLRKIAGTLGGVRDLDVLMEDIKRYQSKLKKAERPSIQPVLDALNAEREVARAELLKMLDKGEYRRFVMDFGTFLTSAGAGARSIAADDVSPSQVRHVLPTLLYSHLGQVRAYDAVLDGADDTTIHALRIEFKRLRYAVSLFSSVLGETIKDFIGEIKDIQDHLGRFQDISTATARLSTLGESLADEAARAALQKYLDSLQKEHVKLRGEIPPIWANFNTPGVQLHFASAVAAL